MKANGREIPYVVSGNGGYLNLAGFRKGHGGKPAKTGVPGSDGKGNILTLEAYNDQSFGFVRITVSAKTIVVNAVGVDQKTKKTSSLDNFSLDLAKHVVTNGAGARAAKAHRGRKSSKRKGK